MHLPIAYSPCPNDTFIFDAMVHQKIDTEGLTFSPYLADVEALNLKAFDREFPITKLSYHAFAYLQDQYRLLASGSALGKGIGPLLIAKEQLSEQEIIDAKIAVPGKYTTAAFLFKLAYPKAKNLNSILFSDIEQEIKSETVGAGVIIHENRFTYAERGFKLIEDLGTFWERKSNLAIPLGGIAVDAQLPLELQEKINRVLRRSVDFAMQNPDSSKEYVFSHAQEMSKEIQDKHIKTYVNEYSVDLGDAGRKAVMHMFKVAKQAGLITKINQDVFV